MKQHSGFVSNSRGTDNRVVFLRAGFGPEHYKSSVSKGYTCILSDSPNQQPIRERKQALHARRELRVPCHFPARG